VFFNSPGFLRLSGKLLEINSSKGIGDRHEVQCLSPIPVKSLKKIRQVIALFLAVFLAFPTSPGQAAGIPCSAKSWELRLSAKVRGEIRPDGFHRTSRRAMTTMTSLREVRRTTKQSLILKTKSVRGGEWVKGFKMLRMLNWDGAVFENFESLASLKDLEHLSLSKTGVKNIEWLRGFSKLHFLNLDQTAVESFEPLAGLKNLHTLWMGNAGVKDLAWAKELNLTKIVLDDNPALHSVAPLARNKNLE